MLLTPRHTSERFLWESRSPEVGGDMGIGCAASPAYPNGLGPVPPSDAPRDLCACAAATWSPLECATCGALVRWCEPPRDGAQGGRNDSRAARVTADGPERAACGSWKLPGSCHTGNDGLASVVVPVSCVGPTYTSGGTNIAPSAESFRPNRIPPRFNTSISTFHPNTRHVPLQSSYYTLNLVVKFT